MFFTVVCLHYCDDFCRNNKRIIYNRNNTLFIIEHWLSYNAALDEVPDWGRCGASLLASAGEPARPGTRFRQTHVGRCFVRYPASVGWEIGSSAALDDICFGCRSPDCKRRDGRQNSTEGGMSSNVQSIADGGALYHRSLIEKQKFKICKQLN